MNDRTIWGLWAGNIATCIHSISKHLPYNDKATPDLTLPAGVAQLPLSMEPSL